MKVPSDLEIARRARLRPIKKIARSLGLKEKELLLYGDYKAKVSLSALERLKFMCSGFCVRKPTPIGTIAATQKGKLP